MLALGIAFLLAPSPARAGHWAISYNCSGASKTRGSTAVAWTTPVNAATVNEASDPYGGESCVGTFSPLLTWTKDSGETTLPPAPATVSALLTVTCTATAPSPVRPTDSYGDQFPMSASTTYTGSFKHLEQKNNAALATTITLPDVQVTCYGTSSGPGPSTASASLTTQITTLNLTINLTGTKKDSGGTDNILVGQRCSAGVTATGGTISTPYKWDISGTTFQSWSDTTPANPNATPPTPANSNASYYLDGPGLLTNSTANWYWNDLGPKPTTETVKCTVNVTPTGQSAMQVTVAKPVIVQVPAWTASGIGGYMQVNNLAPMDTEYELWGDMTWTFTVHTPTSPAFGTGSLEIVQLVKSNDSYTTYPTPPVINNPDPLNGKLGLDLYYPYNKHVYTEAAQAFTYDDTPGQPLTSGGISIASSAVNTTTFNDWLMYQPPSAGNGVQWVPLATFNWNLDGHANVPSMGKWSNYAMQYGANSAGTVVPVTKTNFTPSNLPFPSWTQIIK